MWKLSLLLIIGYVQALTDEEVKTEFIKIIMKCSKDHPVEMSELIALQKFVVPTDKKTQCLLACAYKNSNVNQLGVEYKMSNVHQHLITYMKQSPPQFWLKESTLWADSGPQAGITVMNDKGEFDLAANYEIANAAKGHDEKLLANAKKLADICAKVNEVKVTDGTKGCQRAALIFECIIHNAPKLGFKI